MGTAALVLGVVALVLVVLILFSPLGVLLGLVAVVLGILGIVRVNRREADNRGQVVAGLVTGALALVIGLFFAIGIGTFFATNVNDFRQFGRCMDNAGATRPGRPAPSGSHATSSDSNQVNQQQGRGWSRWMSGVSMRPHPRCDPSATRGAPS